jgi:hypothetical protein
MGNKHEGEVHEKSLKDEIRKTLSRLLVNNSKFYKSFDTSKINWNEIRETFFESNKGKVLQSITTDKSDLLLLYMMINPIEWEKIILGKKFKKYIPIYKLLQTEDWMFILQHTPINKSDDIKDIIIYFLSKIN